MFFYNGVINRKLKKQLQDLLQGLEVSFSYRSKGCFLRFFVASRMSKTKKKAYRIQGSNLFFARLLLDTLADMCRWRNSTSLRSEIFPRAVLPRGSYVFPKLLKYMFLNLVKIQNYFCLLSKLGSQTLKPVAFEDAYLHPVASRASEGRILNTKQLHNIEQLLITNQQFFK